MAEKLDPKEVVTFKELLFSNMFEQEALINVLVKKGSSPRKRCLRR